MNNIVKAVKLISTLTPDEYKLVRALARPPKPTGKKMGRPRKVKSGEVKAKRTRRIEPTATE